MTVTGARSPKRLENVADGRCARWARRRARRARATGACARRRQERRARWSRRASCAPAPPPSSRPTSSISRRPPKADRPASYLDRLMLDPKRIEGMAKGLEEIAALPDPVGSRARAMDAAQRPRDRARARAARRHRHHLREPAQRDGRRRRAVPQGRQRGDPARRLGQPSFQPRHPGLPRPRPARGGPAGSRDPARAHHRPRGRRPDAEGARRRHRRDRAARRQEPRRARAGRGARAGVRAPGRHLPHLRRPQRRPRRWPRRIVVNAKMRRTGVCGATETLLVDRAAPERHRCRP